MIMPTHYYFKVINPPFYLRIS